MIDADQHFVIKDMKHHCEQFVIAKGKGGRETRTSKVVSIEVLVNAPQGKREKRDL